MTARPSEDYPMDTIECPTHGDQMVTDTAAVSACHVCGWNDTDEAERLRVENERLRDHIRELEDALRQVEHTLTDAHISLRTVLDANRPPDDAGA